jgi:hypothetical protein
MNLFVTLVLLLASPSAMAYVDPGSGMLMIQAFIALLAGVVAFVKNPVKIVKDLWRRLRNDRDA